MCQKRVVLNAFRFNTQNLRAKIEVYYMLFDLIHIQNLFVLHAFRFNTHSEQGVLNAFRFNTSWKPRRIRSFSI